MIDYISELEPFNTIWLATSEGCEKEILVTESVLLICKSIENGFFDLEFSEKELFFVFDNETFEDAYQLASDMREGHPKHL